jgi:hypothetical protein
LWSSMTLDVAATLVSFSMSLWIPAGIRTSTEIAATDTVLDERPMAGEEGHRSAPRVRSDAASPRVHGHLERSS